MLIKLLMLTVSLGVFSFAGNLAADGAIGAACGGDRACERCDGDCPGDQCREDCDRCEEECGGGECAPDAPGCGAGAPGCGSGARGCGA